MVVRESSSKPRRSGSGDEAKEDDFLRDWLTQSAAHQADAKRVEESTSSDERDAMAASRGFRTWRQHRTCTLHCHALVDLFSNHNTFLAMWKRLREVDAQYDLAPHLYGPHNGGVPASLLRSLEVWYQQPKLTRAQRTKHNRKIVALCDDLLELLNQVTPSGAFDSLGVLRLTAGQTEALFARLRVSESLQSNFESHPETKARFVSEVFRQIGITPTWAVLNVAASARLEPHDVLPPKVNTATAFRTHFIRDMSDALWYFGAIEDGRPISDALFAEVVSLVANMDCAVDDVRKAIKQQKLERKRLNDELIVHREGSE